MHLRIRLQGPMPVTAVRDEGALRMWVCRLPVHIGPLRSCEFAEDSRKNTAFCGRTESSAPTGKSECRCRGRRLCRPEKCCEFAWNFHKNSVFCRADVDIGLYNQAGKCIRIRRRFPNDLVHPAGRSRATPLPTAPRLSNLHEPTHLTHRNCKWSFYTPTTESSSA